MILRITFIVFLFSLLTCSPKITQNIIKKESDIRVVQEDTDIKRNRVCSESSSYIPQNILTNEIRLKLIRVNFHYMNSTDSTNNFDHKNGRRYAKELLFNANKRLLENEKMKLPKGNQTEKLSPLYQYELTRYDNAKGDIYFHYDDKLYYFLNKGKGRNNYDRKVLEKYDIRSDSVLNVFVMPHHPDTLKLKYYKGGSTGIALGNSLKIAGLYESGKPAWEFGTLLNHEIGHVLGLRHSWNESDGCDDTPKHKNCWDCETASNNMMDYNNSQMAITPCQIGRIHKNLTRMGADQRELVRPDWCVYDPTKDVIVKGEVSWNGERDLAGDLIIKEGARLTLSCRLSMPSEGRIIIEPGGTLTLVNAQVHNSCGYQWDGIITYSEKNKIGKIISRGQSTLEDVFQ